MAKKAKAPEQEVTPKVASYTASIKLLGTEYSATGQTSLEAISNLNPKMARGVSVLTVSNGRKTMERILPRVSTVRLFSPSRLIREIQLKQMAARFDI